MKIPKKGIITLFSLLAAVCIGMAGVVGIADSGSKKAEKKTLASTTQNNSSVVSAPLVSSFFSAEEGVSLMFNQDTPSYVEEKANGVLVQGAHGKSVDYLKQINLSDNTKEDLLFECQVTPQTLGVCEFDQIILRLEDAVTPTNFIEISLYRWIYSSGSANSLAQVTVNTSTISGFRSYEYGVKTEDGVSVAKTPVRKTGVNQGTAIQTSFVGSANGVSHSIKLYYDNEEKTIYVGHLDDYKDANKEAGYADENGKVKVLDLDSYADMGTHINDLWKGWTNGFVNLSVTTNNLVGDSANYMILTIDNQKLDGEKLHDVTPPVLTIDMDKNNIPYGVVGQEYKFASATAVDDMYGEQTAISKTVFLNGQEIKCTNQGFVPTQTGTYIIRYSGYDLAGNQAYEDFEVEVLATAKSVSVAFSELSLLSGAVPLDSESVYEVERYQEVLLPSIVATGVSGDIVTEIRVKNEGENIAVQDGVFIAYKEGLYSVEYILTDYLDNIYRYVYQIRANYSGKAFIKTPAVNEYMLSGVTYKLPQVEYTLSNIIGGAVADAQVAVKIFNADTNILLNEYDGSQDNAFTPNLANGANLKVIYEVAYEGIISQTEKTVTVLPCDNLIDRFLTEEGVAKEVNAEGSWEYFLKFSTQADEKGVQLVNSILYDNLYLQFNIPKEKNNFNAFNIYLTAVEDETKQVKISFVKGEETAKTSAVYINDVYTGQGNGDFYGNTSMNPSLTFKSTGIYDNDENFLGNVTSTVYGEAFEGFSGKRVKLRLEFSGVTGESEIQLITLNNQLLGNYKNSEDYAKPSIYLSEDVIASATLGERLYIPKAYANDVFDQVVPMSVILRDSAGNVLLEKNYAFGETEELEYVFRKMDTYTLQITAKDSSGNTLVYSGGLVIKVGYYEAPIIYLDGEMPTSGKVGEKITLPSFSVADFMDGVIGYTVYITDPLGGYTKIANEFTPTMKGVYTVAVYATNSNNRLAVQTYVIVVK